MSHNGPGSGSVPDPGPRTPVPCGDHSERHELSVRLGLRFIKGLREEAAKRIEEEAGRAPFASVREVASRCGLRNDELAALARVA